MFGAGSSDLWHWSEDVLPQLDFCVRALRADGLQVPPFDRHPDGDHGLRERGLTPEAWRSWVERIVFARARLDAAVRADPRDPAGLTRLAADLESPPSSCPGTRELQDRLAELWAAYRPEGDRWKRELTADRRRAWFEPRHERWLWNALVPFHGRLETMSVFLVDYEEPAVMVVPPVACLIAQRVATRDGAVYARDVLRAAEELAGRALP